MLLALGAYLVWGQKWHLSFMGCVETTPGSHSFLFCCDMYPRSASPDRVPASPLWEMTLTIWLRQLLWVRTSFLAFSGHFTFLVPDESQPALQSVL